LPNDGVRGSSQAVNRLERNGDRATRHVVSLRAAAGILLRKKSDAVSCRLARDNDATPAPSGALQRGARFHALLIEEPDSITHGSVGSTASAAPAAEMEARGGQKRRLTRAD